MPNDPHATPHRPGSATPRRRLTYSNIMSTLAVGLVLTGGTAVAATQIGSADIINGSIASADLKDGSVRSADIHDGSISIVDLDASLVGKLATQGPRGETGDRGPRGPRGLPGKPGVSGYTLVESRFRLDASALRTPGFVTKTLFCPAGKVALSGDSRFSLTRGIQPPGGWHVISAKPAGSGWTTEIAKANRGAPDTFLNVWTVCANKS